MEYFFPDNEIKELTLERKEYNGTIADFLNFKESDGHKRSAIEIPRPDGSAFIVKLRQNTNTLNDFSAILAFQQKGINKDFKLRRYNGLHEHTNKLENIKFFDFHIHYATQRYQEASRREESYAEITDRYFDIKGALKCLIDDCLLELLLFPLFFGQRRIGSICEKLLPFCESHFM